MLAQRHKKKMSRLVMTSSRSEEDGVVSVPAESSITSSVSSIVDMVRSCVGRGSVGGCVSVSGGSLGISTKSQGSVLETVHLLHLSGLPRKAGHSVHGDGLTREVGEINVLDRDDEIAGGGGHGGHNHGEGE